MSDDIFWLTTTAVMAALLWMPYTLERIVRVGFGAALAYAPGSGRAGFEQPGEKPAPWAERANAAHKNLLESLPVFAALVLSAHFIGIGDGLVATAAMVFFYARLMHFIVYLARLPIIRTAIFFVSLGAQLTIAHAILTAV